MLYAFYGTEPFLMRGDLIITGSRGKDYYDNHYENREGLGFGLSSGKIDANGTGMRTGMGFIVNRLEIWMSLSSS